MSKETKNVFIKFRATEAERAAIQEYAAAHGISMSELIRTALNLIMSKENEE